MGEDGHPSKLGGSNSAARRRPVTATTPRVLLFVDFAAAAGLFFAVGAQQEAHFLAADAADMIHDWDVSLLDVLILATLRVLLQFAAWSRLAGLARTAVADPQRAPAIARTVGRLQLWVLSLVPLVSAAYCIAKLVLFETSGAEALRRGSPAAYQLAQALVGTSLVCAALEAVLGLGARGRFQRMCGLNARAFTLNSAGGDEEEVCTALHPLRRHVAGRLCVWADRGPCPRPYPYCTPFCLCAVGSSPLPLPPSPHTFPHKHEHPSPSQSTQHCISLSIPSLALFPHYPSPGLARTHHQSALTGMYADECSPTLCGPVEPSPPRLHRPRRAC